MSLIFKNLKVVELASVLAGPATSLFFAELGAKVIKIENPETKGDVTRSWKLPSEDPNAKESAYFKSVNFKKKSVFLSARVPSDKEKILKLISEADILIVNFKKGDDKKLGLDYAAIKRINSKIIYASIQGFPDNDDRLAYDLILQAETGFMSMNGTKESGPLKMPVALIDILAAHHLKEAILLALMKRANVGLGSKVSVSLYSAAIASLANQATNWLIAGHNPFPQGSLHPNISPYGEIFTTKDKSKITFAIGSNKHFVSLCKVLKLEKVAADAKFSDNRLRVLNRKKLFGILNTEIKKINYRELFALCSKNEIPIAKIKTIKEVFSDKYAKNQLISSKNERVVSSLAFKFH